MDTKLLGLVLAAIESERDGPFFHASELVRQLVAICGESDLAGRLYLRHPRVLPLGGGGRPLQYPPLEHR